MSSTDCDLYIKTIYPALTGNPKSNTTCCSGFTECNAQKRIIAIDLSSQRLQGKIPPQLSSLTNLMGLQLSNNSLTGPIPDLSACNQLANLYLGINRLDGTIPESLSKLTSLSYLELNNNQLSGSIPLSFGSLVNLQELSLGVNNLTGQIPPDLTKLTKLTKLSLISNKLSGPIPQDIGKLINLETFLLFRNQLSGPIPDTVGNLVYTTYFDLSFNQLEGPIPSTVGNLVNMEQFYLKANQLTGLIPVELGKMLRATNMDLSENKLTMPVPDSVKNLPNYAPKTFIFENNSGSEISNTSSFPVWAIIVIAIVSVLLIGVATYFVWRLIKRRSEKGYSPDKLASKSFEISDEELFSTHTFSAATPSYLARTSTSLDNFTRERTIHLQRPGRMSLPASSDRTAVPDTSFSASILSEFNLDKPQTPVRASNSTPVRPGSAPPRTNYPPRQSYGLDTNPTSKSSSNRSESSGPIFFFSDVAIDDSFLNYVTSLYLPINSNIKATENHIAYVNSEVTVTKGDILTVLEHTLDGWCYGRNVTKQSDGKFPVYCVTPKHTTLLNYINCYKTPKSFIIPEKIEYVENVFPGLIKFHYLDLNNIVESSLYPIFGTLNGDEKCLIHGSMEMTQFMTGFLKEFGESFWKDLDIETV